MQLRAENESKQPKNPTLLKLRKLVALDQIVAGGKLNIVA
jgi:hypothetical protein